MVYLTADSRKKTLCGQSIRKDIDEEGILRPDNRLVKNNDEIVVDFEAPPNGKYLNKFRPDPGIDKRKDVQKSML